MKDEDKSREQLLQELAELRARVDQRAPGNVWSQIGVNPDRIAELALIAGDDLFIYDGEGRYIFASRGAMVAWSTTPAGILGRTWRELGYTHEIERFESILQSVLQNGEIVRGEINYPLPGGPRVYSYVYGPLRNAAGQVVAVASSVRDVTQAHLDQASAREAEERLRILADSSFEAVFIHDRGRILLVNETGAAMFGYTVEELIGRSVMEIAAPGSRERLGAIMARSSEEIYLATGLKKDASTFVGELQGKAIPFRGREVRIASIRDVTERQRTEQALRNSEAKWRTLAEHAPDFIVTVDRGGFVTFVNRLATGRQLSDILGQPVTSFVAPADRDRLNAVYEGVFTTGKAASYEVDVALSNGHLASFRTTVGPIFEDGRVVGAVAISSDLTEYKQALEEVTRRTLELERVHELDRLKGNLLNAVSHELRTPLTSIKGYGEFLEDGIGGPLTETQLGFVAEIQRGAIRLEHLVDDLLDFGRIDAGTLRLRFGEASLDAKVKEIAASLQPLIDEAGLTLDLVLACDRPISMDPQRIGQVITNLLHNAIKFTAAGGSLSVRTAWFGDFARCEVVDTGVGIAPDDLHRLFRRFTQLENGIQKGGGTGLGLSIAKVLVEAHGGTIGVSSEPGMGSTFWFQLPVSRPEIGPGATTPAEEAG